MDVMALVVVIFALQIPDAVREVINRFARILPQVIIGQHSIAPMVVVVVIVMNA